MSKTNLVTPISVRVVLDQMRAEIVHAFSGYEADLKAHIDAAMKSVIDSFDFEGEVRRILRAELSRRVEWEIRSLVDEAIRKAEISSRIGGLVSESLKEHFGNDQA